ncbi:MAG: hypothetical protein JRI25_20500 [Deltaproteobacteria bacterium]|nr:hypothetical protein [Deltaproteobacteria bacterium]MBW2256955.1 hypothetical protein [Deltaproteobacteria bacterium]
MQYQVDQVSTRLEIRILGVNGVGYESGNTLICDGTDLPWLQPIAGDTVWTDWGAAYRDVFILDENNVQIGVYNLSVHNLSVQAEFDGLKQLLLDAAQ